MLELFDEDGGLAGVLHRRLADWPDEAFDEVLTGLTGVLTGER